MTSNALVKAPGQEGFALSAGTFAGRKNQETTIEAQGSKEAEYRRVNAIRPVTHRINSGTEAFWD